MRMTLTRWTLYTLAWGATVLPGCRSVIEPSDPVAYAADEAPPVAAAPAEAPDRAAPPEAPEPGASAGVMPDDREPDAAEDAGVLVPAPEGVGDGAAVSVIGVDRSHWPTIVFTPADGTTVHHPHYVQPVVMGRDAVSPLDAPTVPQRIERALAGAEPENYSLGQLKELVWQPAEFGLTLIKLPVLMVLDPPLSRATTP